MIKKLISKLANISKDKLLHFIVSFILYFCIFKIFTLVFEIYNMVPYILTGVIVFGIGIAKEYFDQKDGGIFDFKDLLADLIGILLCMGICLL